MIAPEVVWTTNQVAADHDAKKPYMSIYFSGDLASASKRELNQQWTAILGSLRPLLQ